MLKFVDQKGVSLTIVIGLITVLMLGVAIINQLVIRQFHSIGRIENSNKAYLAAEAGLEDALYELSPHYAGYETPTLGTANARYSTFNHSSWKSEWSISGRAHQKQWSGHLKTGDKLNLFLSRDESDSGLALANREIQQKNDPTSINLISFNQIGIIFSLPDGLIPPGGLKVDNDGDFGQSKINNGLNEDQPNKPDAVFCPKNPEDNDCDGQVDEDHESDIFIMWRLTDGAHILSPKKGCITDGKGSELCEKDFLNTAGVYSLALSELNVGVNASGKDEKIIDFIHRIFKSDPHSRLRFEFLIVAPMEHVDISRQKKIKIPYISYQIKSDSDQLPYPHFIIDSDGFSHGFKQSIRSLVYPNEGGSLIDFTIIQNK